MDNHGSPYIKSEEDEFSFNSGFMMQQQYQNQQFQQHQNMDMGSVNPSDLTMNNNMGGAMNSSFGNGNMSGSYLVGKSNITDDELLDLNTYQEDQNQMPQNQQAMFQSQGHPSSMPVNQQQRMQQMYSNTPDGAPIMSPFQNGGFDYSGFSPSMPGSMAQNGSYRNKMPPQMSRHPSERSPMTPKINGLHLGTPDSGNFASNQQFHRQNRSESSQWNGTPGSGSWIDSPAASPHQSGLHHPQISDVIASGKHASLPAKVEGAPPNYQSQEAKRRRRRESHNLVERRRRDNINERIQDLSKLVPQHRLEDEKIRKHITANGPLSPGLAAGGISPPQATSLLAGGSGRRAAGGITQGLPPDEKDKGPNKGDILNSSVSWTRDLMWLLYEKLEQEEKIKAQLASHGQPWPFTTDEDEKRMITELTEAVRRNGVAQFSYSRYPGSGLRVPKHTNFAGEPLQGPADSPQSLSPGVASGGSGDATTNDQSFWVGHQGSDQDFALKEEDEFGMEMG